MKIGHCCWSFLYPLPVKTARKFCYIVTTIPCILKMLRLTYYPRKILTLKSEGKILKACLLGANPMGMERPLNHRLEDLDETNFFILAGKLGM